jgi:CheY-like chemotaxis protein
MTENVIETLIYIDDDEIDQMILSRIASRDQRVKNLIGFQMAEDALIFLRNQPLRKVDAILLDINMPKMNGFDFLEAATQEFGDNFAKVVVVMLTTSLLPEDKKRAFSYSSVKGFFEKPPTNDHLNDLLQMIAENS